MCLLPVYWICHLSANLYATSMLANRSKDRTQSPAGPTIDSISLSNFIVVLASSYWSNLLFYEICMHSDDCEFVCRTWEVRFWSDTVPVGLAFYLILCGHEILPVLMRHKCCCICFVLWILTAEQPRLRQNHSKMGDLILKSTVVFLYFVVH